MFQTSSVAKGVHRRRGIANENLEKDKRLLDPGRKPGNKHLSRLDGGREFEGGTRASRSEINPFSRELPRAGGK